MCLCNLYSSLDSIDVIPLLLIVLIFARIGVHLREKVHQHKYFYQSVNSSENYFLSQEVFKSWFDTYRNLPYYLVEIISKGTLQRYLSDSISNPASQGSAVASGHHGGYKQHSISFEKSFSFRRNKNRHPNDEYRTGRGSR